MKEEKLLNAMSEIKDEYIEEADSAIKAGADKLQNKANGKPAKFNWKPWCAGLAAVLALCIGVGSLGLGRMGAAKAADTAAEAEFYRDNGFMSGGSKNQTAPSAPAEAPEASEEGYYREYSYTDANQNDAPVDVYDANQSISEKAETKLVYRADLTVQTLDFDETEGALKDLVKSLGGYFENTSTDNGGYYSNGSYKHGYYTIRIPQEKYEEFMSTVGSSCHVSYINESIEDIGQQYFDVETRLETLHTQLTRLQELLAKASNLSDIIELESKISNTEYEINMYTTTLNRYDSLVGFATIDVNIEQVYRVDDGIQQNNSFLARLGRNLKNGLINFVDGIGDLLTWAAYNLVAIIIIVVAIIIIRKNRLLSRAFNAIFRRKNKNE